MCLMLVEKSPEEPQETLKSQLVWILGILKELKIDMISVKETCKEIKGNFKEMKVLMDKILLERAKIVRGNRREEQVHCMTALENQLLTVQEKVTDLEDVWKPAGPGTLDKSEGPEEEKNPNLDDLKK